jgi:hypothetical protein
MILRSYLKPLAGGLLGFAAGWSLARPTSGGNAAMGLAGTVSSSRKSAVIESPEANRPLRIADGAVWIPQEKLASLASSTLAARMYLDDSESNDWSCVNVLHSCMPMTDDERIEFKKVLQEAARQRKEWERANVTVKETAPGEWMVLFPGDGGKAKLELQRSIETIFGAERSGQIDVLGDTDGFFGMKWLAPSFRHGEIRVQAMVVKSLFHGQENFRLSVEIDSRAIGLDLDGGSLEEKTFAERILPRMGGPDTIRRGAKARH